MAKIKEKMSFWDKVKSKTISSVGFTLIVCAVIYGYAVGVHTHLVSADSKPITIDTSRQMFAAQMDKMKFMIVEEVRGCEGQSYKESDGLVTFDPKIGGKNDATAMSYGTLQFKKSTVIYYYKLLYGKVITSKEAVLIALDDERSGQLATDIMFKTKNMANDWATCAAKWDTNNKIKIIKRFEV